MATKLQNVSDEALAMVQLTREVRRLMDNINPWIGQSEMRDRYQCTNKTITAMEVRGDIPFRVNGRWLRSEVVEWELRLWRAR